MRKDFVCLVCDFPPVPITVAGTQQMLNKRAEWISIRSFLISCCQKAKKGLLLLLYSIFNVESLIVFLLTTVIRAVSTTYTF
jgi:hypothetical protein